MSNKILSVAVLFVLAGGAPAIVHADDSRDVSVLSRRVVQPLSVLEINRHMAAVHVRRESQEIQPGSGATSRVQYTYNVQLPDGSQMTVPESYEVTKTGEHVSQGKYGDLTVYEVRREGAKDAVSVGLTPNDTVVFLNPEMGTR